jgi:hypothetical protein
LCELKDLTRLMKGLLFHVRPADPSTFAAVAAR